MCRRFRFFPEQCNFLNGFEFIGEFLKNRNALQNATTMNSNNSWTRIGWPDYRLKYLYYWLAPKIRVSPS